MQEERLLSYKSSTDNIFIAETRNSFFFFLNKLAILLRVNEFTQLTQSFNGSVGFFLSVFEHGHCLVWGYWENIELKSTGMKSS